MFQEQSRLFADLAQHLDPKAVEILRQLFTDSRAVLEHKGPIVLQGDRRQVPGGKSFWRSLFIGKRTAARFEGAAEGTIVWCRTVADWTTNANAKTGLAEYWVDAKDSDTNGLTTGPTFTVRLIMTGGQQPALNNGDMLAYCYAFDGTRISFPCSEAVYEYPAGPVALSAPGDDELVLLA